MVTRFESNRLLIYRVFTSTSISGDFSTGRKDFIVNYIDMLKGGSGVLAGMPLDIFIENYNNGMYPHNGFLEANIAVGALYGSIFNIFLICSVFRIIRLSIKYNKCFYYSIIALSVFFVFSLLSFFGLKMIWFFFGVIVVFFNQDRYV